MHPATQWGKHASDLPWSRAAHVLNINSCLRNTFKFTEIDSSTAQIQFKQTGRQADSPTEHNGRHGRPWRIARKNSNPAIEPLGREVASSSSSSQFQRQPYKQKPQTGGSVEAQTGVGYPHAA